MGTFKVNGTTTHGEAQGPVPRRFRRIRARVMARDRDWFTCHRGEDHYVRPYVPGELWPDQPPPALDVVMLVTQVSPGVRTRTPVVHLRKGPTPRMDVLDEIGELWLRDVPMEGIDA